MTILRSNIYGQQTFQPLFQKLVKQHGIIAEEHGNKWCMHIFKELKGLTAINILLFY